MTVTKLPGSNAIQLLAESPMQTMNPGNTSVVRECVTSPAAADAQFAAQSSSKSVLELHSASNSSHTCVVFRGSDGCHDSMAMIFDGSTLHVRGGEFDVDVQGC